MASLNRLALKALKNEDVLNLTGDVNETQFGRAMRDAIINLRQIPSNKSRPTRAAQAYSFSSDSIRCQFNALL